ncbi:DUF2141 domain-containing protein [Ulvibacterium sp.]|uniref:DUF2141 domain-containing protein n=1 Tax=Ulvibacterium sp. TaxID=2665914 RepID=UPI002624EE07|nr:DUF2141 domain-containing protein [Ulvibacterium sp.]
MKKRFLVFVLLPIFGLAQNRLSISVEGVKTSDGKISVAIYDSENGFLEFEGVYKFDSTKAQKGTTELSIESLPPGKYAVAIFHDENSNDVLDRNWLGIPKEKIGFSNAKMKTFGPPSFAECAFELRSDKEITVIL